MIAVRLNRLPFVRLLCDMPGLRVLRVETRSYRFAAPLTSAVYHGHAHVLREMCKLRSLDLNGTTRTGLNLLALAAMRGHVECVQVLLQVPTVDKNKTDGFGNTPLMIAAMSGRLHCTQALCADPGVDVDAKNNEGNTALMLAESRKHAACAAFLSSLESRSHVESEVA